LTDIVLPTDPGTGYRPRRTGKSGARKGARTAFRDRVNTTKFNGKPAPAEHAATLEPGLGDRACPRVCRATRKALAEPRNRQRI